MSLTTRASVVGVLLCAIMATAAGESVFGILDGDEFRVDGIVLRWGCGVGGDVGVGGVGGMWAGDRVVQIGRGV
jgi:hypothetical protein